MRVGERIRQVRKSKHISADEVASKLGVSRSTIFRYENGDIEKVPTDILEELSKAIGTTPAYLMGWDSDNDNIIDIYQKLNNRNKDDVISFAKKKLNLQNSKITNLDDYRDNSENNVADVYGVVSAGTGEYLDDSKPEKVPVRGAVPDNYDFAVQVNGDSMEPMLSDKQIIYVKKVENVDEVRNNQFVIAEVDGEAYVKKLSVIDEGIRLVSLNKEYSDIVIRDYNDFTVVGVLVI